MSSFLWKAVTGIAGGAVLLSAMTASPTAAQPDLAEVERTVQRLFHRAEVAAEKYNAARVRLSRARAELAATKADLVRQRMRTSTLREQVAAAVVNDYQGQALSVAARAMLSENPDAFLQRVATASAFEDQQAMLMEDFARETRALELRARAAADVAESVRANVVTMAEQKKRIDAAASEAEGRLQQLEAEQRARIDAEETVSRGDQRAPDSFPSVPASGRGGAAVQFALQQLGDQYVYGAAGPDAWDCSGLTMRAWEAVGVRLPHQSQMQMDMGTPVAISELRPGDLVAYYSPISHVGMYIGGGRLVHAANPTRPVEVVPVDSMPINRAVRVG